MLKIYTHSALAGWKRDRLQPEESDLPVRREEQDKPTSLAATGLFSRKRKPLVFFLGPFRGPFLHQALQWFLFILFSTVVAFTHVKRSFWYDRRASNALPIDLCRLKHLHRLITRNSSF